MKLIQTVTSAIFFLLLFLLLVWVASCCTGCTTFSSTQHDISPDREIRTDIKGTAWFSSAQVIAGIKAAQSDKQQSFGADRIGQQGATNTTEVIRSLTDLLRALQGLAQ